MMIYHGSTICIPELEMMRGMRRLDFGSGFYITSDFAQARRWAQIKKAYAGFKRDGVGLQRRIGFHI